MPTATRQARRSPIESRISSALPLLCKSCSKVESNVRLAKRSASSTSVRRNERYERRRADPRRSLRPLRGQRARICSERGGSMNVCIIGAGAVGGLIGARLAHAGVDVSAIVRVETAAALRKHGWRLQIGGQTITAPVRVARDPSELPPQDYVVVAVKAPAMVAVAPMVRSLAHANA